MRGLEIGQRLRTLSRLMGPGKRKIWLTEHGIYMTLDICLLAEETNERLMLSTIGELQSVDGYMNIALEKTQEYVDGKARRSYGDAFVRGNNGTYLRKSHLISLEDQG